MDSRIVEAVDVLVATLENRSYEADDSLAVLKDWIKINPTASNYKDCILSIISLKLARIKNNISIADSWIDIAGYALLAYAMSQEISYAECAGENNG